MKKLILVFLILIVFPLVNASSVDVEYRILAGKAVVSEEYKLDNAFEIELPEDASGVSVYRNGNLAEVSDKISVNKGEELKVSYVTKEYLEKNKPEIIVFHAFYSPLKEVQKQESKFLTDWQEMTLTLKDYAELNNYILAGSFGYLHTESYYYYVKRDFKDSDEIVKLIRNTKYKIGGRETINYALL